MNTITKSEYQILKLLQNDDLPLNDLVLKSNLSEEKVHSFVSKLNSDKLVLVDMVPVVRITALGIVSIEQYKESRLQRFVELVIYPLVIALLAAVLSKII